MQTLQEGDMALLDMGAEYHFYGSDITCSFPVSPRISFFIGKCIFHQSIKFSPCKSGFCNWGWCNTHTHTWKNVKFTKCENFINKTPRLGMYMRSSSHNLLCPYTYKKIHQFKNFLHWSRNWCERKIYDNMLTVFSFLLWQPMIFCSPVSQIPYSFPLLYKLHQVGRHRAKRRD